MAVAVMALVEGEDVAALEPLHAIAEVGLGRLDHQVHVVRHKAVAEEVPALAPRRDRQQARVSLVIVVVDEDPPPIHAARNHVIDRPSDFVASKSHAT